MKEHSRLLDRWFEQELLPLYDRHQELAKQSIQRKIGSLKEAVEASLRVKLDRSERMSSGESLSQKEIESSLRKAAGKFEEARIVCEDLADGISKFSDKALTLTASKIVEQRLEKDSKDIDYAILLESGLTQATAENIRVRNIGRTCSIPYGSSNQRREGIRFKGRAIGRRTNFMLEANAEAVMLCLKTAELNYIRLLMQ